MYNLDYDSNNDVLYIDLFAEPTCGYSKEIGLGILARLDEDTDKLLGFTFIDFVETLKYNYEHNKI